MGLQINGYLIRCISVGNLVYLRILYYYHFKIVNKDHIVILLEKGVIVDKFMQIAFNEALKGENELGIPIGSVLVQNGKILGKGHNKRIQKNDPILHAEIDCLRNTGRIGDFRNTVLYSTLMPCYLCAGAIVQFKIGKVVVGESDTFKGARKFMESHGVEVVDLDLIECKKLLQNYIEQNPDIWDEDIGEKRE